MNRRLAGKEYSLNTPIGEDGYEWQDWLADKQMDQELNFLKIATNLMLKNFNMRYDSGQ